MVGSNEGNGLQDFVNPLATMEEINCMHLFGEETINMNLGAGVMSTMETNKVE